MSTRRRQILESLKSLEARMDALEAGPHEPRELLAFLQEWWDLSFELDKLEAVMAARIREPTR